MKRHKMLTESAYSTTFEDDSDATNCSNSTYPPTFDNETLDTMNYCPSFKNPISNLILVVLYSFVCLVGVVGNSLVIFVVLKFK